MSHGDVDVESRTVRPRRSRAATTNKGRTKASGNVISLDLDDLHIDILRREAPESKRATADRNAGKRRKVSPAHSSECLDESREPGPAVFDWPCLHQSDNKSRSTSLPHLDRDPCDHGLSVCLQPVRGRPPASLSQLGRNSASVSWAAGVQASGVLFALRLGFQPSVRSPFMVAG